jgi:tRNA(Ile)-lysidine synthase
VVKAAFLQNTERKKLFAKTDHLLLGVSGGRDSMALAHLLRECGFRFTVAHCNFGLRGEMSDGDEAFVKDYFEMRDIKVISIRFQTEAYAIANDCSIQMAARELRYKWFRQLLEEHSFTHMLTAHHFNDTIETFFINLLRGTGLNGLKGIPERSGDLVRPLLFATREQIDAYIEDRNLPYREDNSNAEEKYLRNKLRHQLIPLLKEINPSLEETMRGELNVLRQSYSLLSEAMAGKLEQCVVKNGEQLEIVLHTILHLDYRELLLHEALQPFGFNGGVVSQLNESLHDLQPGKQFHSPTHIALLDRDRILVQPLVKTEEANYEINGAGIEHPIRLQIRQQKGSVVLDSSRIACLDAGKVKFPLQLTRWKEGDSFRPLGMKGSKKLSDFFVAQKMSLFEKQEQWILRNGTEIVWVLGRRVDERYRVNDDTEQTLILEWQA